VDRQPRLSVAATATAALFAIASVAPGLAATATAQDPSSPAGSPAVTAPPPGSAAPQPDPVLPDGRDASGRIVEISPELSEVPATSVMLDDATGRRDSIARRRDAAIARRDEARLDALDASAERDAARSLVYRLELRQEKLAKQLDRVRADTVRVAVARYVKGPTGSEGFGAPRSVDSLMTSLSEARLGVAATRLGTSTIESLDADMSDDRQQMEQARREVDEQAAFASRRSSDAAVAGREATLLGGLLAAAQREVAAARPTAIVAGSDLPLIALDAYWRASRRMAQLAPRCGIDWSILAGVGRSESGHGTHGGATVRSDGSITSPILGIALDGTNGTRAIPDTDGGALDGDPVVDRAVGPMQFLPGTWRRWGADLSGDGFIDPQNLYDAALAAARYLCASGGDLTSPEGQRRAVYAYNRSDAYVDLVLSRASAYATLPVPGAVSTGAPPSIPAVLPPSVGG